MSETEYRFKLALVGLAFLFLLLAWVTHDTLGAADDVYPKFLMPACGGQSVWVGFTNPPSYFDDYELSTATGSAIAYRTWGDNYGLLLEYVGYSTLTDTHYYRGVVPPLVGTGAWGLYGHLDIGDQRVDIESTIFECWAVWLPIIIKDWSKGNEREE